MSARLVLTAAALVVGVVAPTGVSKAFHTPETARSLSPASARSMYTHAVSHVVHRPRFELRESTTYVVSPHGRKRPFASSMQFVAPNRLRTSFDDGKTVGISNRVQIGGTACAWHTGAGLKLIVCSHVPWAPVAVSTQLNDLLVPLTLKRETFRGTVVGRQKAKTTLIKITGQGDPLLCAPGLECFRPNVGAYTATLRIASNGLPISFKSSVKISGHTRARQHADFIYPRRLSIRIPSTTRVPCPPSLPHDDWCYNPSK